MAESAVPVPDLETQKNIILSIAKKNLQKGSIWCLMDNKWYKQWKKYVGYDSWETSCVGDRAAYPGPIDNALLLKDDGTGEIKEHLIDELDYVLMPQDGWDLLSQWYDIVEGQECIARKVIEHGMFVKHCKVEVYLLEFKLCQNHDMDHPVLRKFSKADTIGFIEEELRQMFNIPAEKETRLWNRYSTNTYEHLANRESTVQDAGLYHGQALIIEQKNDDDTWPRQGKSTTALAYSSTADSGSGDPRPLYPQSTIATRSYGSVGSSFNSPNYNYDYQNSGTGTTVRPGLSGLSNLGNTCFMNSALQATSSTAMSDKRKVEVNFERCDNRSKHNAKNKQPSSECQLNSAINNSLHNINIASQKLMKISSKLKHKEDEFDLFGKTIAAQLRNMPLQQALVCQGKIHQLVIDQRIGQSRESAEESSFESI